MDWFIIKENDHQGPFEESLLIEMNEKGEITSDTLVWKEGLKDPGTLKELILEAPPELPPEKPVYNPYKVLHKEEKKELPPTPLQEPPSKNKKKNKKVKRTFKRKGPNEAHILFPFFLFL